MIKKKKYNFLIAGLGRGGKDTLSEILRDKYGITFQSSSYAAAEIFIYDLMKDVYGYDSVQECFDDRHNHRDLWYNLISEYNKDDKAKLAKGILESSDCYVGMRSREELEACKEQGIFSHIFWVDASERVAYKEPESSCTVTKDMADYVINNNGTLKDLEHMADIVWGIINDKP